MAEFGPQMSNVQILELAHGLVATANQRGLQIQALTAPREPDNDGSTSSGNDPDEDDCPEGFEKNEGQAGPFAIPDEHGYLRTARWIRLVGGHPPTAEGTMGARFPTYYQHITAQPVPLAEGQVLASLPPWFLAGIRAGSSLYHHVVSLARAKKDWGLIADLDRYHSLDQRCIDLARNIRHIEDQLCDARSEQQQARNRLEEAQAHVQFACLERCRDAAVHMASMRGQVARRGRGRPQGYQRGGAMGRYPEDAHMFEDD
jgi:hypothetical protein